MTLTFVTSRVRVRLIALVAASLTVATSWGFVSMAVAEGGREPQRQSQPNIVYVTTDDQARGTVIPEAMPNLHELLISQGTSFTDHVATTPLCCPSRATTLTGQYGHNNGVLRNVYGDLIQKRNVLPSWLQFAGYNTAHVGKFLNGYEQGLAGPRAVAPGWDLWFTQLEKRRYYNWKASKNGRVRQYDTGDDQHVTTVTTAFAERWTTRLAQKKDPFYLQLDYYAPHGASGRDSRCAGGPVPEPEDEFRFATFPVPRPPSFDEADVSDKGPFVRDRPPLDAATIESIDRRYRCTLESLYGVDRGIREVYRRVRRSGELNDTVFIFSSDNGFYSGEHRIPKGKPYAYEENLNTPLIIAAPPHFREGAARIPSTAAPAANIDLAPTILDLADAEACRTNRICRTMDGRSLMPLITSTGRFPTSRPIRIEIGDCSYEGVRLQREVYYEYSRAGVDACEPSGPDLIEHYDLQADPFQLTNLANEEYGAAGEAQRQLELRRQMERLALCSGIKGRDPVPASGRYCR